MYLNGDIPKASEDFIPVIEEEKFEEEMRIENEEQYCFYVLIKIYHFLEVFHGIKIIKMAGDFVKDDTNLIWLTNISKVSYELKPTKTRDGQAYKDMGEFVKDHNERTHEELEKQYQKIE